MEVNQIELKLQDGQSGYDVVEEYIKRYWSKTDNVDTVIVSMETSYDGRNYYPYKDVACVDDLLEGVEFTTDWWEGEKYIRLLGIRAVGTIDVSGGIYTE